MAYAASDYIKVLPALSTSPLLQMYIDTAAQVTDMTAFGADYQYAIALRAMHNWTLDQRPLGESGAVQSKAEGRLSQAFNTGKGNIKESDLSQTSFGVRLQALIKKHVSGFSISAAGYPNPGDNALDPDDVVQWNPIG